jgi:hypothetical protein
MYASNKPIAITGGDYGWVFLFSAGRVVPVANENRPASISVLFLISY